MVVVTGCAGFIGSHLVDRLLSEGERVLGLDNFSTGQTKFIDCALANKRFELVNMDLLNLDELKRIFAGVSKVYHLAANADVRHGVERPGRDLEQNTLVTHNVLEAMRANKVETLIFSSTGSVYGDAKVIPTPEDAPFPIQTSLYGASKAACEGLISAYSEAFGIRAFIFRFVSILGERYSHGHVFDFYRQLMGNSKKLLVLGNGRQKKSYLYVGDCIEAISLAVKKHAQRINIYNLGVDAYCEVNDSIGWICEELGISPNIEYSGGDRGWVGDSPFIFLDTSRIVSLGWRAKHDIRGGIIKTVKYLAANEWVLDVRGSS